MIDFRGTEILVGSTIVYAVKASTYPYVTEAVVLEVTEVKDPCRGVTPALKVQPTGRGSKSWRIPKGRRAVTLTALDRVVVVS